MGYRLRGSRENIKSSFKSSSPTPSPFCSSPSECHHETWLVISERAIFVPVKGFLYFHIPFIWWGWCWRARGWERGCVCAVPAPACCPARDSSPSAPAAGVLLAGPRQPGNPYCRRRCWPGILIGTFNDFPLLSFPSPPRLLSGSRGARLPWKPSRQTPWTCRTSRERGCRWWSSEKGMLEGEEK